MQSIQQEVTDLKSRVRSQRKPTNHLLIQIPAPDQQEYYNFFLNMAVPCVVVSLSGLLLDVNTQFCSALTKEKEHLIGRSIFSVAHPSSLPLLYTYVNELNHVRITNILTNMIIG